MYYNVNRIKMCNRKTFLLYDFDHSDMLCTTKYVGKCVENLYYKTRLGLFKWDLSTTRCDGKISIPMASKWARCCVYRTV